MPKAEQFTFSVNLAMLRSSLRIEGKTPKAFDDIGESVMPVQRLFCGKCGSPIASCSDAMQDLVFLKFGTLDDTAGLNPTAEIWCETVQPWVAVDEPRSRSRRNPTNAT